MTDAPERIWIDCDMQPWRVWTIEMTELRKYIRADLHEAALRAARVEGYEIARREAVARGFHLVPEVLEGLR